jgi:hypothetical protein
MCALFLLPADLSAEMISWTPTAHEAPIEVRVKKPGVYFRKEVPQTDKREDGEPYADPNATYNAYRKEKGRVAGYYGYWIRLENRAHQEERGWVADRFVAAIHSEDEVRLERLGSPSESSDAWLQNWGSVANIIDGIKILGGAAVLFLGWLVKRFFNKRKNDRVRGSASPPAGGTGSFPRAVPPPSVTPPASEPDPSLTYGVSGGSFWIHRSKKRQQGGRT